MKKFISYDKASKAEKKRIDALSRRDWGVINPATKVMPNKKVYNRKKANRVPFEY